MATNTLIAHPNSEEQEIALRSFLQSKKIDFEVEETGEYDPEFVAKILESNAQADAGQTVTVKAEDLKSFLGLE